MVRLEVPRPIGPDPNRAVIVFVRPSSYASALTPTILSSDGRFLGDADPSSHFAVAVPPGDHFFLVWGENTGPLHAQVAAGRVYYVEVSPKPGWWSARVHLLAITPKTEQWGKVSTWIAETKQIVPKGSEGQAYLDSRAGDVAERIRRAKEAWVDLSPEEQEARTLRPNDGVVTAIQPSAGG